MAISLRCVFLAAVGFLLLSLCVGCSKYDKKLNVDEVSELLSGELSLPEGPFDYYMEDGLRGRAYVIYLRDRSFFDLNKSKVAMMLESIKIESGTSWDLTIHFENSSHSPPFDYDLFYDYFQLYTGDPHVEADGVLNEEHGVYMLRIKNFESVE